MHHVVFFGLLVAAATAFALLEVQIEGADGWARALPTWRIRNRWTQRFLGGRDITGYHVWIHVFVLLFAHLPYAVVPGSIALATEMRILGFLALFWVLEDFLWFVFNPRFGLRRFRPQHIPWHAPDWWGIAPRDYWLFTPAGLALYLLSTQV